MMKVISFTRSADLDVNASFNVEKQHEYLLAKLSLLAQGTQKLVKMRESIGLPLYRFSDGIDSR